VHLIAHHTLLLLEINSSFDNIEITGGDGGGSYFYVTAPNIEIKNMYMHGWATGTDNDVAAVQGEGTITGSSFHDSVIDGSDTNKNFFNGVYLEFPLVYNVYVQYVVSGFLGEFNILHDNVVQYPVVSCCGDHANSMFNFGPYSGTTVLHYNNVIRNTSACTGCVNQWMMGDSGTSSSYVAYGFNNVIYNLDPANIWDIAPSNGSGNYGTYYLFNNTVECGTDSDTAGCFGGQPTSKFNVYDTNNHWITSTQNSCSSPSFGGTCTSATPLFDTVSQANSSGYTGSQTYAFSPTASNSPSVGAGTNVQSYCTAIAAINAAAGTACQSDTTYGVGYNTTNHTVITPGRTINVRPTSTAWELVPINIPAVHQYNMAISMVQRMGQ